MKKTHIKSQNHIIFFFSSFLFFYFFFEFFEFLYFLFFNHQIFIMTDLITKQRLVFLLTWNNHKTWFRLMKQWFMFEEFWNVINFDKSNMIVDNFVILVSFFNFIFDIFVSLSFSLKLNTKAQYWLFICIEKDDQKYIVDLKTT